MCVTSSQDGWGKQPAASLACLEARFAFPSRCMRSEGAQTVCPEAPGWVGWLGAAPVWCRGCACRRMCRHLCPSIGSAFCHRPCDRSERSHLGLLSCPNLLPEELVLSLVPQRGQGACHLATEESHS